ncbi:epithelial membrane protein 2-like [Arapaima gigas]
MLVTLAIVTIIHIISAVLLFISTIHNAWWSSGKFYVDLWYACDTTCYPVLNRDPSAEGFLQAVQSTMILATILCCVGFVVFTLQLFRLKQGGRFIFTGIAQLLSALCVMTGASIYTAQHNNFQDKKFSVGNYGYSFVLAWIAFPVTLASAILYLTLRKRK